MLDEIRAYIESLIAETQRLGRELRREWSAQICVASLQKILDSLERKNYGPVLDCLLEEVANHKDLLAQGISPIGPNLEQLERFRDHLEYLQPHTIH